MSKAKTQSKVRTGNVELAAVQPEYKRTEVEVTPEDWTIRSLKSVSTMNGRIGWQGLKQEEFTFKDTDPFLITGMNFKDGEIRWDEVYHIPEKRYEEAGPIQLRDGDILMTKDGTIGKLLYVENIPFPGKASLNSHLLVFRPLNESYIPKFLFYQLNSKRFADFIDLNKSGTTFFGITQQAVGNYPACLPRHDEQRAIAAALSDIDGLIGALDKLITKKRAIKLAAMQQLLTGKTRLPGFKRTEVEVIPEDWTIRSLKSVSTMNGRIGWQGLKQEEFTYKDTDPFLITGMNFKDGEIRWNEVYHIPEKRYEEAKPIQLRDGDILMTKDGTIGKLLYVENIPFPGKASLNSHLLVFRPLNESYIPKFLFYQLNSKRFADFIDLNKSGTTFFGITQQAVGNFPACLPRYDEQRAIATVLSDMDAEIAVLERRRDKTMAIKQGMMQELLSGRIRLIDRASVDVRQERTIESARPHNWQINEAVVISVLAKDFGSEEYPLGRKRYTKLSYLLHRHAERKAEGYMKKAAGPYNPKTKYGGPEKIALKNGYVYEHQSDKFQGFVANGDNIGQAEAYFEKWYGAETRAWLDRFRYHKNDELELLTTVDMAMVELRSAGMDVSLESVKGIILKHPEWEAKLSRSIFSDANIARAIQTCGTLFAEAECRPPEGTL